MRTLDLSVELFNQKVLNLDDADADAAATANPAAAETSPPARRGLPGCISRFLAAAGGPEGYPITLTLTLTLSLSLSLTLTLTSALTLTLTVSRWARGRAAAVGAR